MSFVNQIPEWENTGTEPSESLRKGGFAGGYKPPASVFNWFWNRVTKAIAELQGMTPKDIGAANREAGIPIVPATSTDGVNFTATVDGVTELYDGLTIRILPSINSKSTAPYLNVNGLGNIRIAMMSTFNNAAIVPATIDTWLSAMRPVAVTFHQMRSSSTGAVVTQYWIVDWRRPSASGLYGEVPVQNGGWYINSNTTDEDKARAFEAFANLGLAVKSYTSIEQMGLSDADLSATDFSENMNTIVDAINGTAGEIMLQLTSSVCPNLHASLVTKLNADQSTITFSSTHTGWLAIHFCGDRYRPTVVETNMETANHYGNVWACMFNKGGAGNTITPFRTVQETEGFYSPANKPTPADIGASPAIESEDYPGCFYRIVDGEKEWLNPPMLHETAYRTTERFMGVPVYTMLMKGPSMKGSSGTSLTFPIVRNFLSIIGTKGILSDGNVLPHITNEGATVHMRVNPGQNIVSVALSDGLFTSDVYAVVTIKYINSEVATLFI